MSKSIEILLQMKDLQKKLAIELNNANKERSTLDKTLTDIHHYIEFNDLSTSEIYHIHTMQCEVLRKRRECKDEIVALSSVIANLGKFDANALIGHLETKTKKRAYKPRVLHDLFK